MEHVSNERGQVVPLLAVVLVLVGVIGIGLVDVGAAGARRAAAQAAADAVALAGAAEGRPVAEEIAVANEARIVAYRTDGFDVSVTVERRGIRARARAAWDLRQTRPGSTRRLPRRSPGAAQDADEMDGSLIPYTPHRVS